MNRLAVFVCLLSLASANCLAQQSSSPNTPPSSSPTSSSSSSSSSTQNTPQPSNPSESSSRDTRIDLSPPRDDTKTHPDSKDAVTGLVSDDSATSPVPVHPWNPLKAKRDIDVGDFYFRRKNYKAALDRYKEALYYKDGDAIANFRLAECQEKLGDKAEARRYYEQYLKILPEGPLAKNARASLERLAKAQ